MRNTAKHGRNSINIRNRFRQKHGYLNCYIFVAKNPDACVGDESRINKVKRIFFFTAPKKKGFFFV